jgi:hypothetical protein
LFSQMLTLYITPAFYVAMEHLSERLRKRAILQNKSDDDAMSTLDG